MGVPRLETTDQYWVAAQLAAKHESLPDISGELLGAAELAEIECVQLVQGSAESDSDVTAGEPSETN